MIAGGRVRRTKIVATVGPASDSPERIGELIDAGVDVFRLGLAHDSIDVVLCRMRVIRQVAQEMNSYAAILVDLPGPKVRAGTFGEEGVVLTDGSEVELHPGFEPSSAEIIHVSHEALVADARQGDVLQLGDGRAVLKVTELDHDCVRAEVLHGGVMRGRPGVHIPSDRLSTTTPTAEDIEALDAAVLEGVDMVAVSFVRSAHDVRALGLERAPAGPLVVAKIETEAAIQNLDAIGEDFVAPGNDGVDDVVELAKFAGGVEVSEPVESFEGAIVVVGLVETVESSWRASQPARSLGWVAKSWSRRAWSCSLRWSARCSSDEAGSEHVGVECRFDAGRLAVLQIAGAPG